MATEQLANVHDGAPPVGASGATTLEAGTMVEVNRLEEAVRPR